MNRNFNAEKKLTIEGVLVGTWNSPKFLFSCKRPLSHSFWEADFFKESGIELFDAFVDPLVIHHQKGPKIARLDVKGLKTMLSFIEKIEEM
ncbi:hypothetical protein RHSIM_Rhsim10G0165300 [Rhododendron simsii]|uniref:Uncharacterized protein n=1 Tax=Rhododendron simsii TaxID=118357 RepID=A0A834GER8_RHOSS|nr:hypothetical protein RHSIM_Rhsim10G0165300 [Rhododendron simsii]